ncbi:hypothetical protein M1437_03940 [Patescibacteria group bacterium]|nr:hypothetical protein [Patescibacteria group bacterium]
MVFPKTYETCKEFLDKDQVVFILGRVDKREEELSLIVEKINLFDPESMADDTIQEGPWVEIYVPAGTDVTVLQNINRTLRGFPGSTPVTLLLSSNGGVKRLDLPFNIDPQPALEDAVVGLLGEGAFKIV